MKKDQSQNKLQGPKKNTVAKEQDPIKTMETKIGKKLAHKNAIEPLYSNDA